MFDSDEDGLLSQQELTRAVHMLHSIKTENTEENEPTAEGKGDSSEGGDVERREAEQLAKVR